MTTNWGPSLLSIMLRMIQYFGTHMVKNLPVMQKTQVRSLGQEDPWRRNWQPTPVFLPGESHGQRSLVGYSPWGHKKLDTTEQLTLGTHLMEVQQPVFANICKSKMHGAYSPPDVASLGKQGRLDDFRGHPGIRACCTHPGGLVPFSRQAKVCDLQCLVADVIMFYLLEEQN